MRIEHQTLTDRIHLLIFPTQRDVTSTLLRFQEHYESPKFRGKIFSLEEFKRWYVANSPNGIKTGEFTYYTDWNGFNIPSYVLQPFRDGKFNPLSEQERKFLDIFKDEQEPFYIIGVHQATKKLSSLLKHEIAHGLFYTDANYRGEVQSLLSQSDIESIKRELRSKAGYHEQVLEDECQAYSIASGRKLKTPIPIGLQRGLRGVFRKYLKLKEVHIPSPALNITLKLISLAPLRSRPAGLGSLNRH